MEINDRKVICKNSSFREEWYCGTIIHMFANIVITFLTRKGLVVGIVLAAVTGLVIWGGVHRIGFISSVIVSIMATIYILMGLVTIVLNITQLPHVIGVIVKEAFDVQVISVFIDTILICSSTAFMLLMSGVQGESGVLDGIPYVQAAIKANVGEWGIHFITVSIFAFAFTGLIGNYCYAESNILFIKNNKVVLNIFRVTCLVAIFLGAQADFGVVWNLADVTMGFMAIVNIIAIFLLGKLALKVLKNYEEQEKEGKNPVFYEDAVGLKGTVWKREK